MVIFFVGISVAIIIGVFTFIKAKKSIVDPSLKQISDTIEEHLNGTGGPYDWCDFINHQSFKNPNLEKIRTECADIAKKFPPDDPKAWCSELGKNELLKISERVIEESNKVEEARKKTMAEAKARQPATNKSAAGKSPMSKGPPGKGLFGKGPLNKAPLGKKPADKTPAANQPALTTPVPAAPLPNPAMTAKPVPGIPVLDKPVVAEPIANAPVINQPAINPPAQNKSEPNPPAA